MDGLPMPRGVPRVVAPPRRRPVFSWARRPPRASSPPARVVSPRARRRRRARRPPPPRVVPLPHRGRRPFRFEASPKNFETIYLLLKLKGEGD